MALADIAVAQAQRADVAGAMVTVRSVDSVPARAEALAGRILTMCVEMGGSITGEHGVGVEKRDLMPAMFNEVDLAQQMRLKCAFDEHQLLNPGKVFPTLRRCAELGAMHVSGGKLPFPDLPRF